MVAEGIQDAADLDAADLVEQLEGMGVQLWVEDAQVRYRAPRGIMTSERLESLRQRRGEDTALLTAEASAARVQPDPRNRFSPFPLTDVQAAYLTGRAAGYSHGGVGCHGYGELRFDRVEAARLDAAWNALVRRHDML